VCLAQGVGRVEPDQRQRVLIQVRDQECKQLGFELGQSRRGRRGSGGPNVDQASTIQRNAHQRSIKRRGGQIGKRFSS